MLMPATNVACITAKTVNGLCFFFVETASTNLCLISQHVSKSNDAHAAVFMNLPEAFILLLFHVAVERGAAHCEHLPSLLRTYEKL